MIKNKFNIIFFLILLSLVKFNFIKAENQIESYDMSNVKIIETPFWCTMTVQ